MNNNISIFIAAHRLFNEYVYPMNDMYTILCENDLSFKHNYISLNHDEFTKRYAKLYGEGCALYYLYKHPELLKDYVVFYHYRRYFTDFINNEDELINYIDKYDCLVPDAWFHPYGNYNEFVNCANEETVQKWINIIKTNYPEYSKDIEKWKKQQYQHSFNIFGMKKENFLKMCDFSFDIMEKLCKEYKLYKDEDVDNINLQLGLFDLHRLIGYFLEYTTHLYYEHNFPNLYECNLNMSCWHLTKQYYITGICIQKKDIDMNFFNWYTCLGFNKIILINPEKHDINDGLTNAINSDYIFIFTNNNVLYTDMYLTISNLIENEMVNKNYESLIIQNEKDSENDCYIYKLNENIKNIDDLHEYYKDQHNICDKSIACMV